MTQRASELQIYDSQGHPFTVERFPIRFRDIRQLDGFPPDIINKAVLSHLRQHGQERPSLPIIKSKEDVEEALAGGVLTFADPQPISLSLRHGTPTIEILYHTEHVYDPDLGVVSTSSPDPIAAAQQLINDIPNPPISDKICMDVNIPKYYLLLHDPHLAPQVDPEAMLAQLKNFSGHAFLVNINSVSHSDFTPTFPVPEPTVRDIWTAAQAETNAMLEQVELAARRTSMASVASGKDSIASPMTDEGFPIFKEKPDLRIDLLGQLGPGSARSDGVIDQASTVFGAYMTETDMAGLESFAKQFAAQKLVKHMETSVQQWNEQVAANRRGFTGRINRLVGLKYFGGGTRSQGAAPVPVTDRFGVTVFPHNAPEMVMRRLADFAFMLRDYRLAFGTYDSVRKDFQGNDKFVKYHAGTQEMLGLTLIMTDGVGRGSLETYLDAAVAGYQETNASLFSARAAMLHYEMLRQRAMFREAAPLLISMTGEDSDVRSAMFLEQAAISFLQVNPTMARKYAFHLILAGHRYSKCGQRSHAYRCYKSALEVYSDRDWALVEDHVHFTLGRQSFHLGEFEAAVRYFLKLLKASRQSQMQQSSYLREFLYLYKQYANKTTEENLEALPPVPIPYLNMSTVMVSLLEAHSGQPKQVAGHDEIWDTMETELFQEGFAKSGSRALSASLSSRGETSCAVGEPVFVTFEVENPMNIPIQINNVFLECSFGKDPPPKTDMKWSAETTSPGKVEFAQFDVENVSEIALDDKEKRKVQLRIFPKQEGEIHIVGVRFTLCGVVPSYFEFPPKPRGSRDGNALKLTVTSPMPVLDVIFHSFPGVMLSGQVCQVVLEINNKGNRGLRSLQLKTSHPSFFSVGENGALDATVHGKSDGTGPILQESFKSENLLFNLGTMAIQLPLQEGSTEADRVLASGRTTIIPLWIRGDKVGKQNFRFLFGYQSEDARDKVGYRTLRYNMTTTVQPSLRINAFTRPSGRVLDEFILGVEIENLFAEGELVVKQLSSISPTWAIHPIEPHDPDGMPCILQAQQTVFKYFRFKRATNLELDSSAIPELCTMRAIERLLLNETATKLDAPDLTLHVSNVALSSQALSCDTVPFRGLIANSRLQWRIQYLQSLYPGLTAKQLKDLFTFYFTDDVDLSMIWEIAGTSTSGHQYVMGINLGMQAPLQGLQAGLEPLATAAKAAAGKALFESTVREKRALITSLLKSRGRDVGPVRVILKSDLERRHDFGQDQPCIVPITVTIRNTSWSSVAEYSLRAIVYPSDSTVAAESKQQLTGGRSALPQTGDGGGGNTTINGGEGFYYLGSTFATGRLQPEQEAHVTFTACFPHPGVYNVNRWQMTVSIEPAATATPGKDGREKSAAMKKAEAGAGFDTVASPPPTYLSSPNLPHFITVLHQ
ncbi:ER-golgi trafficking TRAPP I complex 85 kDa subunit-domain-containing protein [Powellomyces hirtus]|nr:ER-golgi trafficking TRAPP I complex 85 kDa subunit-domain-containing protein [Powellomyces hirtus]